MITPRAVSLLTVTTAMLLASTVSAAPSLTSEQSRGVVLRVGELVAKHYVVPEKREVLSAALRKAQQAGRYAVTDPGALARLMTEDLAAAGQDKHLYLNFDEALYRELRDRPPDPDQNPWTEERIRERHHGYEELRILDGNVRYARVSGFMWMDDATEAVIDDAVRFLRDGRALVLDLRGNGGGAPEAVQYLVSHFIDEPRLLMIFEDRMRGTTEETHALAELPSGRLTGKPLYVLTDAGTASAAEEFAYHVDLFQLGTLVGATTAGAAHNNTLFPVDPGFVVSISTGRPRHAVNGKNWEGVGVPPHVVCRPELALDTAHLMALEKLISEANEERRAALEWAAIAIRARLQPPSLSTSELQAYVGSYGVRTIRLVDGVLEYQREGRPPLRLSPLAADLFAFPHTGEVRVRFRRTEGKVSGFDQVTAEGQVVAVERTGEPSPAQR